MRVFNKSLLQCALILQFHGWIFFLIFTNSECQSTFTNRCRNQLSLGGPIGYKLIDTHWHAEAPVLMWQFALNKSWHLEPWQLLQEWSWLFERVSTCVAVEVAALIQEAVCACVSQLILFTLNILLSSYEFCVDNSGPQTSLQFCMLCLLPL